MFQHFALLSFFFSVLGVGFILKAYGHDRTLPISTHAARQRVTYWLFLASLVLATICLYLFTFLWLIPVLHISTITILLMTIGLALVLATAIIPDSGGKKKLLAWRSGLDDGVFLTVYSREFSRVRPFNATCFADCICGCRVPLSGVAYLFLY